MKRSIPLLAVAALVASCVPAPVLKSPAVVGDVTDARTHRPVVNARVYFADPGNPLTTTDAQGRFFVAAQHQLGLIWLGPYDQAQRFLQLEITHVGYQPAETKVPLFTYRPMAPFDIELEPLHWTSNRSRTRALSYP